MKALVAEERGEGKRSSGGGKEEESEEKEKEEKKLPKQKIKSLIGVFWRTVD